MLCQANPECKRELMRSRAAEVPIAKIQCEVAAPAQFGSYLRSAPRLRWTIRRTSSVIRIELLLHVRAKSFLHYGGVPVSAVIIGKIQFESSWLVIFRRMRIVGKQR